jgi:two-component system cell cycle response regulator DivK
MGARQHVYGDIAFERTGWVMSARILLIEDNPQNRYLAKFLLEQRGHAVIEAETGPQGLALASATRPSLILLDIQLPGMDGHAVARALKGDPTVAAIPIVAVTSYAMAGDREKCLAAGAEGYIEKPINPDTFATEVERFLPVAQGGADT